MSRRKFSPRYSPVELLMASTTKPMPAHWREAQVAQMRLGLENLRSRPDTGPGDWVVLSDCVNLLETMIANGWVEDEGGFHEAASAALSAAGQRHMEGKALRMSGPELEAVEAALLAYEAVIGEISQRNLMTAMVQTERRIWQMLEGITMPHGKLLA